MLNVEVARQKGKPEREESARLDGGIVVLALCTEILSSLRQNPFLDSFAGASAKHLVPPPIMVDLEEIMETP